MKAPLLFAAVAALITPAAFAQDLAWADLARRSDLWPTQCTVKVAMKFAGGVSVHVGQKATVLEVRANEVQLNTLDGKTIFAADPDETDVLTVARTAYAALTPKQRALTYDTLVRQRELWPARVTFTQVVELTGGKSVSPGDQAVLTDFRPGQLVLKIEKLNTTVPVPPHVTNVMAQARTLIEDGAAVAEAKKSVDRKQAQGPLLGDLDGKLVNSVTGKPQPLDASAPPRYIVFYRGSSTCPITRQFTPSLIKYYQAMKPAHPDVEFVWIMTESADDTAKFAKQLGFNWRAIGYESTGGMPRVSQSISGLLPQLMVMDRNGRVLANGSQHAAQNALRQLDALIKRPVR